MLVFGSDNMHLFVALPPSARTADVSTDKHAGKIVSNGLARVRKQMLLC